ncbi:VOC family protein [Natronolimnobius baerhuensis]|uniref:Ring-cleaving dioxygenase n=1 Tax=Natronolimnobius baerhuensis TaxID=253108 RepID=A0A202E6I4_9EURY|nr:VOC family protein [Natronolimnobius baerhuensis]OVE83849.1 ring-cleaving dioxygenase [Natronolimnobius baerhuensis]
MVSETSGIHHVTGIVGDAQEAIEFYTGVLGLRLVTQTVNFEDILQHHLYFGDAAGTPGTVLTVFPDPYGDDGRVGRPQVESVSFLISEDSLPYWQNRLEDHDIELERRERFGDTVVQFQDPVGTHLELVARPATEIDASALESWEYSPVPLEHALRGIDGVTTLSVNPYATASLLETLGFEYVAEQGERVRYEAPGRRATRVDILTRDGPYGREGQGTHHHVAVRVEHEDELHEWRDLFDDRGYDVSRVKDRHVFHSLYVREPGGVLVELATETGGVALDDGDRAAEPSIELVLPEWFEQDRDLIESQLPKLHLPETISK